MLARGMYELVQRPDDLVLAHEVPRCCLRLRGGASRKCVPRREPGHEEWGTTLTPRAALAQNLQSLRGEIEAVEIHHPSPHGHKVAHKLLLRVSASVDFRDG